MIALHNIIYSYTCFIQLLMLQPFHKLSRMSPPIPLCNYILHWGSPRCNPPLISQNGEGKKAPEKRKVVCRQIKEDVLWVHGMEGLWRVGVTLRMMGVLVPRLLQRSRGLRGICLKVKRSYPFWWSSTEKGFFFLQLEVEETCVFQLM